MHALLSIFVKNAQVLRAEEPQRGTRAIFCPDSPQQKKKRQKTTRYKSRIKNQHLSPDCSPAILPPPGISRTRTPIKHAEPDTAPFHNRTFYNRCAQTYVRTTYSGLHMDKLCRSSRCIKKITKTHHQRHCVLPQRGKKKTTSATRITSCARASTLVDPGTIPGSAGHTRVVTRIILGVHIPYKHARLCNRSPLTHAPRSRLPPYYCVHIVSSSFRFVGIR